jgi:hypothetical protein
VPLKAKDIQPDVVDVIQRLRGGGMMKSPFRNAAAFFLAIQAEKQES